MIKIFNVSPEGTGREENLYEVWINDLFITTFQHNRSYNGLADCLRCAADAVQAKHENEAAVRLGQLMDALRKEDANIY